MALPHPDLANDATRHVLAVSAAMPLVVAMVLVLAAWQGSPDAEATDPFLWVGVFGFTLCYALAYVVLGGAAFRRLTGDRLRDRLVEANRDGRRDRLYAALVGGRSSSIAVQVSLLALVGVFTVAIRPEYRSDPLVALSAIGGVVGSWLLMTAAFASVYALAWAREQEIVLTDLREEPSFGDFVHVAVQMSTAFSTSGVRVRTRALRRTATAHALVGFCFSTVIVALLVALIASNG